MSWKNKYIQKIVSADEAVKVIKTGDRVLVGHATGEPSALVEAMVRRAGELRDVQLFHMVCMGQGEYCRPENKNSFRFNGCFLGKHTREAVAEGRGDYVPCFFFEIPELLTTKMPLDVALIQVSSPDEDGNCSYGVSCDFTEAGARRPETKVLLQINERMPFTYGTYINLDRADFIVEDTREIIVLPTPKIGEVEEKIGRIVADLVEDGSTLQLGIGAIPDAVIRFLGDKKDLGIHTEMFSDGVVALAEKGVVNNSKKTLHTGKFVASFLMGTRKLYDFVDHNSDLLMLPIDYVNDPQIIARNDKMVSINASMQVDLYGQLNSSSIGPNMYSGVGGQVDFVRGARRSKGGRSIIALPSTAKGGAISKIVSRLDPGAAVTTSRYDVGAIVTEYGYAELIGLNLRERAKALINIAHPDFREQLERDAWENKNLR
ncbi:MAG: 4-hydroxybutyrate CoA-transferase [Candidatus Adiutrix sp.]|jgi:4-hydroxybutyrate CoA-transferase|nr:4-hydroxybutyrate CoA-transferase [Candidatus Adiutrix sp.]